MMQERPIRPHQAIKPKIEVSVDGMATIMCLPIITSRDYRYSLSDLRNVVSVPAEDHRTHAFITPWTVSNLGHPPFEWSVPLSRIFIMRNAHVLQNVARCRRDVGSHWNRSHPSLT
jgi:hypothetical protein